MLSVHRDVWTVYKPNPDWRGAATWLEASQERGRPVVTLERTPADALSFYAPDLRRLREPSWPPSEERLVRAMRRHGTEEIYLLRNLLFGGRPTWSSSRRPFPAFRPIPCSRAGVWRSIGSSAGSEAGPG